MFLKSSKRTQKGELEREVVRWIDRERERKKERERERR